MGIGVALHRSYLFAPAHNERLMRKALHAGADAVVFDLEDAVPPQAKSQARAGLEAFLGEAGEEAPQVFVRINSVSSGLAHKDVLAAVQPRVGGIRLAKTDSPEEVRVVSAWIAEAERERGVALGTVRLDCTVESVAGLAAVREIARADPRVRALVFGAQDLARDLGTEPGPDEVELLGARMEVVIASRLAGLIPPVDGAYTRLDDPEGLRASAERARRLGFLGKSAIHPSQIPVLHEVFTPGVEDVERARRIVELLRGAEREGVGALRLADGQFVDRAVAERARRTLELAERLGTTRERGS